MINSSTQSCTGMLWDFFMQDARLVKGIVKIRTLYDDTNTILADSIHTVKCCTIYDTNYHPQLSAHDIADIVTSCKTTRRRYAIIVDTENTIENYKRDGVYCPIIFTLSNRTALEFPLQYGTIDIMRQLFINFSQMPIFNTYCDYISNWMQAAQNGAAVMPSLPLFEIGHLLSHSVKHIDSVITSMIQLYLVGAHNQFPRTSYHPSKTNVTKSPIELPKDFDKLNGVPSFTFLNFTRKHDGYFKNDLCRLETKLFNAYKGEDYYTASCVLHHIADTNLYYQRDMSEFASYQIYLVDDRHMCSPHQIMVIYAYKSLCDQYPQLDQHMSMDELDRVYMKVYASNEAAKPINNNEVNNKTNDELNTSNNCITVTTNSMMRDQCGQIVYFPKINVYAFIIASMTATTGKYLVAPLAVYTTPLSQYDFVVKFDDPTNRVPSIIQLWNAQMVDKDIIEHSISLGCVHPDEWNKVKIAYLMSINVINNDQRFNDRLGSSKLTDSSIEFTDYKFINIEQLMHAATSNDNVSSNPYLPNTHTWFVNVPIVETKH